MKALDDPAGFVMANTLLRPVAHVPEILLHVADEALPIWEKTEDELGEIGLPPPFWAFAWAGGQALARYLIENPRLVAGKKVIDFASGSGLVAIAARLAGATSVLATDIDPFCRAAMQINAAANGVTIDIELADIVAMPPKGYDVICAGDVFYEAPMAERILPFLEREYEDGATILVGDPGRSYLPKDRLKKLAEYQVPVTRALEDSDIKATAVWTLG